MKTKAYRTRRLELRTLRASDWKSWRECQERRRPKLNQWDIEAKPKDTLTRENYLKDLKGILKQNVKDERYFFAMFLKSTREFLGWVDITTIKRDRYQSANLGWYTVNIYRGNGYAKEAVKKLISVALSDLGFHRLEAAIDPRNKISIKTARACGLKREGLKKHYLQDASGEWKDMMVYIATPELFYDQ